ERARALGRKIPSPRPISTGRLNTSPCVHLRPINLVVYQGPYPVYPVGDLISRKASRLDAFSAYPCRRSPTSRALGRTTGTRELRPSRPSRLRASSSKTPPPTENRGRTVSRRSKPSPRTVLMGEQPNPWEMLHPQDATSRHRGAKPCRRCGLLGKISLLSPGYLLSVDRPRFHTPRPGH